MNRQRRGTIIALTVVAIILVIGVTLVAVPAIREFDSRGAVDLKRIKTTVLDEEGEEHFLDASMTIEFADEKTAEKANMEEVNIKVRETVSELDYKKMKEKDGMEYIKEEVTKSLGDLFTEEEIEGIYVTDIVSDFDILPEDGSDSNRLQDTLKGFSNKK